MVGIISIMLILTVLLYGLYLMNKTDLWLRNHVENFEQIEDNDPEIKLNYELELRDLLNKDK